MSLVTRERLDHFAALRYHRSTRATIDERDSRYKPAFAAPVREDLQFAAVEIAADAGQPVSRILADFGEYLLPDIIHECGGSIDPAWQAIDLVEHLDVMLRNAYPSGASDLEIVRTGEQEVRIRCHGSLVSCYLARGVVHGISRLYGQPLVVDGLAHTCVRDMICETIVRAG